MNIGNSIVHTRKMNIYNNLSKEIQRIVMSNGELAKLVTPELLERVNIEPPKDFKFGDLSSNAALILAKSVKKNPRDLGAVLAREIERIEGVASAEVAGPGFINFRMTETFWHQQLIEILNSGISYGRSDIGNDKNVNIEYVSANPTGPMHVGHGRGAVLGDVLANLLEKVGYRVTREYYINDAGAQVDTLGRSVFLRYREALGDTINEIPEGLYPGDYLRETGKKFAKIHGDKWIGTKEDEWLPVVRFFAIEEMMSLIQEDLAALGVRHQTFTSERSLIEKSSINEVFEELKQQGLTYQGVLERPKGAEVEDWEEREQLLFAASKFGDDGDRPLQKSDGSNTYFAADIAYHRDKYRRGFDQMIDIWGADHKGYVTRMQAAVQAITRGKGLLDVKLCNLVNLLDNGTPVKMSKRSGTFVTLREVIDLVGKDVVRFIMLTRNNEALLDFDVSKVKDQSKDNPIFYVQYAHARICSILRNVKEIFPDLNIDDPALAAANFSEINEGSGLDFVKILANWPRVVEGAALSGEPHRIVFYLQDIAAAFHAFWNRGNDDETLRFIVPGSADKTVARIALARSVAIVISSGLSVIGVEPVKEMR
jgi:arginyl-tRNA synthetase